MGVKTDTAKTIADKLQQIKDDGTDGKDLMPAIAKALEDAVAKGTPSTTNVDVTSAEVPIDVTLAAPAGNAALVGLAIGAHVASILKPGPALATGAIVAITTPPTPAIIAAAITAKLTAISLAPPSNELPYTTFVSDVLDAIASTAVWAVTETLGSVTTPYAVTISFD